MIKQLIKVNLSRAMSSMSRNKLSAKKNASLAGTGIIILMLALVFMMLFATMAFGLSQISEITGVWFYYSGGGIMAFMLMFVGSVFYTVSALYDAKDNELLLSMPVHPAAIVTARMMTLLILNACYGGVVLIPFAAVGAASGILSPLGGVFFAVSSIALILLSAAFTCAIAWIIAAISSRLRRKEIVQTVLLFLFFGAYMVFYFNLNNIIAGIQANAESIASAVMWILPFYWFGRACEGDILSGLLLAAVCAAVFAGVFYLLQRNFISIVTRKTAAKKRKYKAGEMNVRNVRTALISKEASHLFASPMYMFNAASGLVFMVILAVFALVSRGTLESAISMIGLDRSFEVLIFAAVALFLAGMTCISAPSVSLEGKNLWVIKSAPVRARDVLLAKAATHIVISAPPVALSSLLAGIATGSAADGLSVFVLTMLFTALIAYAGVAINTAMPKFDFVSETAVVKQSGAVIIMVLVGMLAAVLLSVAGGFLAVFLPPLAVIWAACGVCLAAALLVRLLVIKVSAKKFDALAA